MLSGLPTPLALDAPAASLPDGIASLAQLRVLALRGNRLAALPAALGGCGQLQELDVRDNQLAALPVELGRLAHLRLLLADNNRRAAAGAGYWPGLGQSKPFADSRARAWPGLRCRLHAVPSEILTGCTSLATLTLHGNPATAEALRELSGWAAFDERRRTKYDKQVGACDIRLQRPVLSEPVSLLPPLSARHARLRWCPSLAHGRLT